MSTHCWFLTNTFVTIILIFAKPVSEDDYLMSFPSWHRPLTGHDCSHSSYPARCCSEMSSWKKSGHKMFLFRFFWNLYFANTCKRAFRGQTFCKWWSNQWTTEPMYPDFSKSSGHGGHCLALKDQKDLTSVAPKIL